MTLIELMRMLRTHLKQIVVIPVVVAAAVFAVYLGKSSSYSATAKMVTYGGSFASVSGLADMESSQASTDDVKVTSTATSSSNTISITAKAADEAKALSLANEVVSTLSQTAKDKQVANDTTVETADEATRSSKNPLVYAAGGWMGGLFLVVLFYMFADLVSPRVHGFELVETMGLTYLGTVENDPAKLRLALANIDLSGMGEGKRAKKVRLLPAGSGVRASDAARLLLSAAGGSARLALAASLDESPDVLFRAGSGESLVVVVEQEVTTVADLEELKHELGIAKIDPAGFVFLPYSAKAPRSAQAGVAAPASRQAKSSPYMQQGREESPRHAHFEAAAGAADGDDALGGPLPVRAGRAAVASAPQTRYN